VTPIAVTAIAHRAAWTPDGSGETTHQLRAEVTFDMSGEPKVTWLDAAHVADLMLTADELVGAEESAIDAAIEELARQAGETIARAS